MVTVRVQCQSLFEKGWIAQNSGFEVLPRIGEEIRVEVRRGDTAREDELVVKNVFHRPVLSGTNQYASPRITLVTEKKNPIPLYDRVIVPDLNEEGRC